MAAAIALAAQFSVAAAGEIIIRDGDSIAFVGDAMTVSGGETPSGYVRLVLQGLEQEGVKAAPIPAGVAGDTAERTRNRIDAVLAKKPTWLLLSTGFNDVWQAGLEDFKKHVVAILDASQAAGVKVVILTPTLHNEAEPDGPTNRKAAAYVDFLRHTAHERNLPLADLNAAHRAEITRLNGDDDALRMFLAYDGPHGGSGGRGRESGDGRCHMGPRGSMMMAAGILEALGFTDEQIAKARERWKQAPYRRAAGMLFRDMTVGQFEKAEDFAAREKVSVNEVLEPLWARALVIAAGAAAPQADLKTVREAARIRFGKDLDTLLESGITVGDLR